MKIGFWGEALFECQEDVNEITKNHTRILRDLFVLAKMILGVTWRFDN